MANPNAIPPEEGKFKPGQTGNPNGRPKKLPALDVLMEKVMGEEKDGVTAMEAIVMKLRQQAAAGNIKASEILLDRAFGKAKQSHDLLFVDPDGNAIQPVININVVAPEKKVDG